MTDIELMIKVINGDVDKFGVLYERYKTPLYGYFFKLTKGDISSSEDLVQGVFYKALKYKHSFKGTGEFSKWLFSIAHNLGIDHLKKRSQRNTSEINEDRIESPGYENRMEKEEEINHLYYALDKLDEAERELLIMSKIKCIRYKEIAEIHNSTESAIKTRVFRSLKRLKEIYYQLENSSYEKK